MKVHNCINICLLPCVFFSFQKNYFWIRKTIYKESVHGTTHCVHVTCMSLFNGNMQMCHTLPTAIYIDPHIIGNACTYTSIFREVYFTYEVILTSIYAAFPTEVPRYQLALPCVSLAVCISFWSLISHWKTQLQNMF